ncbi:hypothetical protein [Desulfosporosinus sp. Sb-LF]|nr:hypothetical protein [Desulfosporosinus sp. Sb-LF]
MKSQSVTAENIDDIINQERLIHLREKKAGSVPALVEDELLLVLDKFVVF